MPRFFFHLQDGKDLPDDAGIDLPGLDAAKHEALLFAGAILADEKPAEVWTGMNWSVKVTDSPTPGGGRLLLSLNVLAIDHTAS